MQSGAFSFVERQPPPAGTNQERQNRRPGANGETTVTAGAASGNNRERRLAQSKGNPRRPNARFFCEYKADATFLSRAFAGKTHTSPTNGKNIRRATVSDLLHRSRNHRSAPTTRPALAPVCTTVAPQEPTGSEDTRQYRNATLHHVPAPVPFPVSHPSSGLQLRPPGPVRPQA